MTERVSVFERARLHDQLDLLIDERPDMVGAIGLSMQGLQGVTLSETVSMVAGMLDGLLASVAPEAASSVRRAVVLHYMDALPAEMAEKLAPLGLRRFPGEDIARETVMLAEASLEGKVGVMVDLLDFTLRQHGTPETVQQVRAALALGAAALLLRDYHFGSEAG